jgi:Predicted membrane protein (DUF2157)
VRAWRSRSPGSAVFYTAGFWLLEIRRAPRNVGHGFVFVGAVLFGASLFLVGQMYNVEAHDALGFAVEAPRYERAMAERRLLAEVVLDDDGDAQLDDLVIEG